MPHSRRFRKGGPADYGLLAEIMFDAARNGESRYTEEQRAAWVPAIRSGPEWTARLERQHVVLAEEGGEAIGFMSLADGGYVDFAYIRPKARHSGLFRQLLGQIIQVAGAQGVGRLWTHASLMAEPAFAGCGFVVLRRERVAIGGEQLDRCEMELPLPPGPEPASPRP